jgi:hypothetical protein
MLEGQEPVILIVPLVTRQGPWLQVMNVEVIHKPKWEIERILEGLLGQGVRVAAESFSPARWNYQSPAPFIPSCELILPDNSRAGCLPVYFEGRLQQFIREIGVFYVQLESAAPFNNAIEGIVPFRGKMAVILRGAATVRLAFPFQVEKLPVDAENYWRDLQIPRVQFKLPL